MKLIMKLNEQTKTRSHLPRGIYLMPCLSQQHPEFQ